MHIRHFIPLNYTFKVGHLLNLMLLILLNIQQAKSILNEATFDVAIHLGVVVEARALIDLQEPWF